ncbi:MAG: LysM peptidoglycan-binding domain-containing protein [Planctomycetes bacterium]|nr:LysM peptidoglycan-binding domain-containing protein [Planctomycetota bacterium]
MKRLQAVAAIMGLALALLTFGCEQPKKPETEEQAPPPPPVEPYPNAQIPEPEHHAPAQPMTTAEPAPPAAEPITTIEPAPSAPRATKAKPKESYAPTAKTGSRTYVVRKGDTLQKISQKFYGTTKNYMKIYNANKGVLKDGPNKLPVGTKIVIP